MGIGHPTKDAAHGVKERLREEMRKYAIVSVYLYVCLGAVLLYKAALIDASGGHFLLHGIAAAKALILGKFLLIGDAMGVGTRPVARTLLARIAWRTVLLLALLVALTIVEELVVGWVHGHAAGATMAELRARSLPELAAECMLLLLILFPLVATTELNRALGPGRLKAMLFGTSAELP
jgi:hypothetical protein